MAKKPDIEKVWSSWETLFTHHPRPWCSGTDTKTMKGGILDAQGRLVHEIESVNVASMLAYAVNELTDKAISYVDSI